MGFSIISGLFLAGAKEEIGLMGWQESQLSIFDTLLCNGHFFKIQS